MELTEQEYLNNFTNYLAQLNGPEETTNTPDQEAIKKIIEELMKDKYKVSLHGLDDLVLPIRGFDQSGFILAGDEDNNHSLSPFELETFYWNPAPHLSFMRLGYLGLVGKQAAEGHYLILSEGSSLARGGLEKYKDGIIKKGDKSEAFKFLKKLIV